MKNSLLSSPTNRGLRVRKLRDSLHLSRPQLAKLAKCGESSLQFWEDGKGSGITEKSAKVLIDFFNQSGLICSSEWLLDGIGPEPVLASTLSEKANAAPTSSLKDEIQAFHHWHADAITLLIVDDVMTPFYQPRDYVAGKKKYGKAIELLINQHCIVEIENHQTLCRVVKPSSKKEHFTLIGTNPYASSETVCWVDVKVISAAKVIWIRRGE